MLMTNPDVDFLSFLVTCPVAVGEALDVQWMKMIQLLACVTMKIFA